jgi:uncharacterized coiled-coil protein SlyX
MSEITPEQRISELEKRQAVMDVKMDGIIEGIKRIETNHLVHINDSLTIIKDTVSKNQVSVVELVNTKVGEIYKQISGLKISDAKTEPSNQLFNKIIEYIVLGVIAIGIALIASNR